MTREELQKEYRIVEKTKRNGEKIYHIENMLVKHTGGFGFKRREIVWTSMTYRFTLQEAIDYLETLIDEILRKYGEKIISEKVIEYPIK
jgi:hypothetical protein